MKHLALLLLILAGTLGGVFFWWSQASQPLTTDATSYSFVISRGLSASSIAEKLENAGFIRSALAFKLYVQLTNKAKNIPAGDYRLSKNHSLPALVDELIQGPVAVWVTLPEGLRREEVATRVTDGLGLQKEERVTFIQAFLDETVDQEGFLFPDTYLVLKTATPQAIIDKLTQTFNQKVETSIIDQAVNNGLSLNELVTMASIIERETRTEEERPVVAGILLKRLEARWPLQADATLQYAIANTRCKPTAACEWWQPVTVAQKAVASPFNTYTNRGLPPHPIANPGLSSLKAAANPHDSVYWFYLHDPNGTIHYARTSEEHQENIRKYLQ